MGIACLLFASAVPASGGELTFEAETGAVWFSQNEHRILDQREKLLHRLPIPFYMLSHRDPIFLFQRYRFLELVKFSDLGRKIDPHRPFNPKRLRAAQRRNPHKEKNAQNRSRGESGRTKSGSHSRKSLQVTIYSQINLEKLLRPRQGVLLKEMDQPQDPWAIFQEGIAELGRLGES